MQLTFWRSLLQVKKSVAKHHYRSSQCYFNVASIFIYLLLAELPLLALVWIFNDTTYTGVYFPLFVMSLLAFAPAAVAYSHLFSNGFTKASNAAVWMWAMHIVVLMGLGMILWQGFYFSITISIDNDVQNTVNQILIKIRLLTFFLTFNQCTQDWFICWCTRATQIWAKRSACTSFARTLVLACCTRCLEWARADCRSFLAVDQQQLPTRSRGRTFVRSCWLLPRHCSQSCSQSLLLVILFMFKILNFEFEIKMFDFQIKMFEFKINFQI